MIKHRLAQIKRYRLTQILLVSGCWFLATNCFAAPISSEELIQNAREYDGKTVVYKGEVIGDIMARNGFAWINVNDGINAIGIWADRNLIKEIFYTGNYKSKGDIIEVKGIFHRACLEHGGDLDIHIDALHKIEEGMTIKEKLNISKRNWVFILLGALCILAALSQLKYKTS
jgi:hypothetical protein